MLFKHVISSASSIYAVTDSGAMLWYRDMNGNGNNAPDGSTGWAPNSGHQIGAGWGNFSKVFGAQDGSIYAIKPTGELLWYKDNLGNGTNRPDGGSGWAPHSGSQIGKGWNVFSRVFCGNNGVIYAIKPTGELCWYQDLKRDGTNALNGTNGWAHGSGRQIGVGWNVFSLVFASPFPATVNNACIIYAIKPTGELLWYEDVKGDGSNAPNGTSGWDHKSGSQVGVGWNIMTEAFSPGGGFIYAINTKGQLLWYEDKRHDGTNGPQGGVGWDTHSGSPIGAGWYMAPVSLPSKMTFSNTHTFGNGVAVGGSSQVVLHQDGTFVFSGHFHDSGAVDYNIALAWVVKDTAGNGYSLPQSGRVSGTFGSGSRDLDWVTTGSNDDIATYWTQIVAANSATSRTSVDGDISSLINQAVSALGQIVSIVQLIAA